MSVILDSLAPGTPVFTRERIFLEGDIADVAIYERIFADHPYLHTCVHCAVVVVTESAARTRDGALIRSVLLSVIPGATIKARTQKCKTHDEFIN